MTFLSTLCHSRWAVWLCFDCRTPGFWAKYSPALQSGASTGSICTSADRFQESTWMVKCSATEQTEQPRSSIDRCSRWLSKSSGAIDAGTQEAPLQADSFTWATQKTDDCLDHKDIRTTWKKHFYTDEIKLFSPLGTARIHQFWKAPRGAKSPVTLQLFACCCGLWFQRFYSAATPLLRSETLSSLRPVHITG